VDADVDVDASGLLDGLQGDARRERAELIGWLLSRNFTIDEIRSSDSPVLLTSNRAVTSDGNYESAREVCEKTGVDLDLLQRLQRAMGLPRIDDVDAAVLPPLVGDAAARFKSLVGLSIDEEQAIQIVRLLAEGLARAAQGMRRGALGAILRPGATELELAQASEVFTQAALPLMGPIMQDLLLLQLHHDLETEATNRAERATGSLPGARQVAAAFADLVGFTQLGEALPPEDLQKVANRLGDLARDVVNPPVRVVKEIGDAVMLVCPDPVLLLETVLDLLDAAATEDDLPRLRVGIAFGPAANRNGDWFGKPINLASRVTGVAWPGAVLVDESAREAIADAVGIAWSFAGSRRLRGVADKVRLYRARRAEVTQVDLRITPG